MGSHAPADAPSSTSQSTSETAPTHKEIRITNQGKMKSWITAALDFLSCPDPATDDERVLVLDTLPISFTTTPTTTAAAAAASSFAAPSDAAPNAAPTSFASATSTIPRLISVAEIIKREFVNTLAEKKSTREMGLFQYNEIGTLEELRPDIVGVGGGNGGDAAERANQIIHAMGGQNHPRQTQTPYMRITLSTTERPELLTTGASYQPPTKRKFSKSAKARAKKRAKKAANAASGQGQPVPDDAEEKMELSMVIRSSRVSWVLVLWGSWILGSLLTDVHISFAQRPGTHPSSLLPLLRLLPEHPPKVALPTPLAPSYFPLLRTHPGV
ncbi:hypothetical protein D9619_011033 [Psilocybe cf. subviscida]|uniref:Uncharacterized protein n=1 Tax=Psilocybe cf. subviscida TaxID=2480587 RepID=A0A8H5B8B3_9AGAR|nr:hypothetical protein D9619_011033 [Psilocybe cf. subviscida]